MRAAPPATTIWAMPGRPLLLLVTTLALGVVPGGVSTGKGGRIAAHLTRTSFTVADAGRVKLSYRFSSASSRFAFVLSRRQGTAWRPVRSVSRKGTFRGTHTMTVTSLFGPKQIAVGGYRVRLSGSANSVTLRFAIVAPAAVRPEAGTWRATGLSGPVSGSGGSTNPGDSVTVTSIFFTVGPDRGTVSGFGFAYDYSGPGNPPNDCAGRGSTTDQATAPIVGGRFSTPATNQWSEQSYGTFDGTFDSPTSAHGSAWFRGFIGSYTCRLMGYANTGNFSWTATRQG